MEARLTSGENCLGPATPIYVARVSGADQVREKKFPAKKKFNWSKIVRFPASVRDGNRNQVKWIDAEVENV
jgi:hypothetical protein